MATLSDLIGFLLPSAHERLWGTKYNRNFQRIDGTSLGQFAIKPLDVDASTGAVVGLRFAVSGGNYLARGNFPTAATRQAAAGITATATPSATTYAWAKYDGTILTGSAYPDGAEGYAHAPIGRVVADASTITSTIDDRQALLMLTGGGDPSFLRPAAIAVFTQFGGGAQTSAVDGMQLQLWRMDCSSSNGSVTLPAATSGLLGALVIVKETSGSGHTLTVLPTGSDTINKASSYVLDGTTYNTAVLMCRGIGPAGWEVVSRSLA